MDLSPEYVKMCEKAEEIQALKYKKSDNIMSHWTHEGKHTWLPRQDQLQEILNDQPENPKRTINRLYDFSDFVHKKPYVPKNFKTLRGLPEERDEACHYFDSMEQLWLAFVMSDLYQKVWSGTDWVRS